MRGLVVMTLLLMMVEAGPADAAPGIGDPIYAAKVKKGVTEFESRYGRLTGKTADSGDGLVFELEHAFSSRLSLAVLVETGRAPTDRRTVDAFAIEGVYTTGSVNALGIDTALYIEAKHGLRGDADVIEVKELLEHQAGKFDSRLNVIAEKPMRSGEPVAFSYAASADWALVGDEIRLGVAAFGDLGTIRQFAGREEHYIGPEAKVEIERAGPGEFEVEVGWLRAFGAARDRADGQARLLVGYEAHF